MILILYRFNNYQLRCYAKTAESNQEHILTCAENEVCQVEVNVNDASNVRQAYTKGCERKSTAIMNFNKNEQQCRPGQPNAKCYFYCESNNCNNQLLK